MKWKNAVKAGKTGKTVQAGTSRINLATVKEPDSVGKAKTDEIEETGKAGERGEKGESGESGESESKGTLQVLR